MRDNLSVRTNMVSRGWSNRKVHVLRVLLLLVILLFIGNFPIGLSSEVVDNTQRKSSSKKQSSPKKPSTKDLPKYDCMGDLNKPKLSEIGLENIDSAIDAALAMLRNCPSCRQMFNQENPKYAIALLSRLRKDKAIVVSAETPAKWTLSKDGKKLTIIETKKLNREGAGVVDLEGAGKLIGEMTKPCVYINPNGFIVTGESAESFALYSLKPPVQRALAILHELGHVAGVLQDDSETVDPDGRKSVASTNCVRMNCIECQVSHACPGAPEPVKRH